MELSLTRTSFSVTVLVLVVCSVESLNYLAFPRMGRSNHLAFPRMGRANHISFPRMGRSGYLAFPRMGRGDVKAADITSCCGVGLKNEFLIGQDGKETFRVMCPVNAGCCEGLTEVVDEQPGGNYYSVCVPDRPDQRESNAHPSQVSGKVNNLLRK